MGAPHKVNPDVNWVTDKYGNVVGHMNDLNIFVPLALSTTSSSTALPMLLQSSGSVGNNGALTLGTPIPLSGGYFWGCYMYFAAGKVYAGSIAGMYFVIMSSNSAGTIYDNMYQIGTPRIPDILIPIVATGPGAYTQVTTTVDLLVRTIMANSMGNNGRLIHQPSWVFPSNAHGKSVSAFFGAMQTYGKTRTTATQETPLLDLRNRGIATRQFSSWASTAGPATSSSSGVSNGSIDTTADVLLYSRAQMDDPTDFVILESDSLEIYPFQ